MATEFNRNDSLAIVFYKNCQGCFENNFGNFFSWSQQGMILRPPDYESGATNQLSYGTLFLLSFERLPRWASYRRAVITTR